MYVEIYSPRKTDADEIANEISHLPMFNGTAETPFQPLEVEQERRDL